MSSLEVEVKSEQSKAVSIQITEDTLGVELIDGRTIRVPLEWYPRLYHGSETERSHYVLLGFGEGIHWPDLDEDILVSDLLIGNSSQESLKSFQNWMSARNHNKAK